MSEGPGAEGNSINEEFEKYSVMWEQESDIRHELSLHVRELDRSLRLIQGEIHRIHSVGSNEIENICKNAKEMISQTRNVFSEISSLIPIGQYYRYIDLWKGAFMRLSLSCSLIHWLETRSLLTLKDTVEMLNLSSFPPLRIELDTYLLSICALSNELSRYCVNCAAKKDYKTPKEIARFVADLFSAFQMLNLKNDNIRRRFDSMKYDVKTTEQVVYDISVRSLDES